MIDRNGKHWPALYPKDGMIYMRIKDRSGEWVGRSTKCRVGQEEKANKIRRKTQAKVQAAAEFAPNAGPITVRRYAERWIKGREERGLPSASDDASRLKRYVYPTFGEILLTEVRPRHVRDWVQRLRLTPSRRKGVLAPRTVRNAYGLFHCMMHDALVDELIDTNPVAVKRGDLPGKVDKNPEFRRNAVFHADEVVSLISDVHVPEDRRVLYAILFLTGVRFGEMAALRWRDYDDEFEPLGKLHISAAYSTKQKKVKDTKTSVVREVPVHPLLAAILSDWQDGGWRRLMGREPQPGDLIVPSRGQAERPSGHRSANHMLKKFRRDTGRLKIPERRQHDARRTLVSLARSGGANPDALKIFTHGSSQAILDLYTTFPWTALCEAMLCVRLPMAMPEKPEPPTTANGLGAVAQQSLGDACYALATALAAEGPENAKGPQPWMVASLGNWRGVRDSNPWPPA